MPNPKKVMLPIETTNKDVTTTFSFIISRHPDITVDEQRLLTRILEVAGQDCAGRLMKDVIENCKLEKAEWGDVRLSLNVKEFMLMSEGWSYEEVENVLRRLSRREFEYRDGKQWRMCTYITSPSYTYGSGEVSFIVPKMMWFVLHNFASGYRKFELDKALTLPTTYSYRFYLLMSGQRKPFYFSIEEMFLWLGLPLEDQHVIDEATKSVKTIKAPYRDSKGKFRPDNIERRILKPAQEILDKSCPWSFKYDKIKENPAKTKSRVIGYQFYPTYIDKNRDQELANKEITHKTGIAMIHQELQDFLRHTCGFKVEELNKNRDTLLEAQKQLSLEEIAYAWGASRGKKNEKGYFIAKVKGMTQDAKSKPKETIHNSIAGLADKFNANK